MSPRDKGEGSNYPLSFRRYFCHLLTLSLRLDKPLGLRNHPVIISDYSVLHSVLISLMAEPPPRVLGNWGDWFLTLAWD
ncbi:hypothetical protein TNCT_98471 [Trichonephila clavata]|uniref:Uncharacterized protein n=1 Tax=Trichonephila clavata TaxID=2740835 RepID=A0A8X6LVC7_TRICU|nr:hypothetical protein TNCT_98471 [Trichonephila clavata]